MHSPVPRSAESETVTGVWPWAHICSTSIAIKPYHFVLHRKLLFGAASKFWLRLRFLHRRTRSHTRVAQPQAAHTFAGRLRGSNAVHYPCHACTLARLTGQAESNTM